MESCAVPLKAGDGIVFDTGGNTEHEQGGRLFQVSGNRLSFEHGKIHFSKIPRGSRVWKTSDPSLDRALRQTFSGHLEARTNRLKPLDISVGGRVGEPLLIDCQGHRILSRVPLEGARTRPLCELTLGMQLGKLGGTPFLLGTLDVDLPEAVILPIAELNRMRRELVAKLTPPPRQTAPQASLDSILPSFVAPTAAAPKLTVLVRSEEQLLAALEEGVEEILVDYEDIRRYKEAVAQARAHGNAQILLATPRIQKAGEEGFFKLIANANPDGVLIRNIGGISHFSDSPLRLIGDFSLNVANPATASVFMARGLERLTLSHDLNASQILAILKQAPSDWFELTIHHHMPMFHMEHCVFAAFLSNGTDHTNCGRPCEKHRVHLKDRVGVEHPLRADVGCRNTLFHATAQTGAAFFDDFLQAGLRKFRVELLEESAQETKLVIQAYRDLLSARKSGKSLYRELHASSQVGVTSGTYSG